MVDRPSKRLPTSMRLVHLLTGGEDIFKVILQDQLDMWAIREEISVAKCIAIEQRVCMDLGRSCDFPKTGLLKRTLRYSVATIDQVSHTVQ